MDAFGLPQSPGMTRDFFTGDTFNGAVSGYKPWKKPQGKSMACIVLIGAGGSGGNGVIGNNSTAAGGGGGGSGAITIMMVPLDQIPDTLYVRAGQSINQANPAATTQIIIHPSNSAVNHVLGYANNGGNGGNASGATGGTAGAAGAIAVVGSMPRGWMFVTALLAGAAGTAGGTTGSAAALTLPVTGIFVTGGTGGGGLPAAAAAGTNGGSFTVPAAPSVFPAQPGGQGSSVATDAPANGSNGYQVGAAGFYFYGGTGGASTHGSASGAGLQQSSGGAGGIGSGGGGSGGALLSSAAGSPGAGGPGAVIITCW